MLLPNVSPRVGKADDDGGGADSEDGDVDEG